MGSAAGVRASPGRENGDKYIIITPVGCVDCGQTLSVQSVSTDRNSRVETNGHDPRHHAVEEIGIRIAGHDYH